MNNTRFHVFMDFVRAIAVSVLVGLVWSCTAILLVFLLARNAEAADAIDSVKKAERLGDANESALFARNPKGRGDFGAFHPWPSLR